MQSRQPVLDSPRAGSPLPTLSVVTPSFNQAAFLEETLRSIQGQGYPALEHIVVDGGSTDGSREVIGRHRAALQHVVSEPDDGQYDAINKGFRLAGGEVLAWLNSDDAYLPGTLRLVGEIFRAHPHIEWLTTAMPAAIDGEGRLIRVSPVYGFTRQGFLRGDNLPGRGWRATAFVQQESTFWRRSLWERCGGRVDASLHYAGDFDLWARFFQSARLYAVDVPLACYRRHAAQKTASLEPYFREAEALLCRYGGRVGMTGLQTGWVAARRAAAMLPPGARRVALRRLRFEPAPRVTYDWAGERWVIEER